MKVALIADTLFHQGVEFVVATLARGMVAKGHRVDVILSARQEELAKTHPDWVSFALPKEVTVQVMPYRRARQSFMHLRRLFKRRSYDVVMNHASPYTIPMVLAGWSLSKRPRLIHVEHLSGIGTTPHGDSVAPRLGLRGLLVKFLMRLCDAQCAVSEGTAAAIHRMSGYPESRLYTVFNPVIDEVFFQKIKEPPSHPWLVNPSVPVIVSAGAFSNMKNHHLLFLAFAKVLEMMPARLIVFGEGKLRQEYEASTKRLGIDNNVSLPGFTDNLPAEIKNASCFVCSSYIESFSVVLVEALACGVPCVSTDAPYGPREVLDNGRYGKLVPNHDVDALANAIVETLKDGRTRQEDEAWNRFTVNKIVARYDDVLKKVCGCQ